MFSRMASIARTCFALALALAMLGCQREAGAPAKPGAAQSPAPAARRRVVLQSDWFPQAEHGGYYQALAKGFYADAGIDVEIWPGGPGAGIKLKVAKGDADFGMHRSDDVILAASRGIPLTMVMATFQHDPMALMVHEKSPVRTLADLEGRAVIGNVSMVYFTFLEKKLGLRFERRQNTYGLGEFLANTQVVQQCMVTNEPFFAAQQGRPVRTLSLADAGYDSYHVIFCRREITRLAPEAVRAFVQASIRGWRDYLEGDPAPAHAEILKRNKDTTPALLDFSRREMIRLRLVQGDAARGEAIGQIAQPRVREEIELLLALKILEAPVNAADVAMTEFWAAGAKASR